MLVAWICCRGWGCAPGLLRLREGSGLLGLFAEEIGVVLAPAKGLLWRSAVGLDTGVYVAVMEEERWVLAAGFMKEED